MASGVGVEVRKDESADSSSRERERRVSCARVKAWRVARSVMGT